MTPGGSSTRREVRLEAPAKVNLILRVGESRPDGFHELETLFQAVSVADEVEVALVEEGLHLEVAGADLGPTADNLAHRAAAAFLDATDVPGGVAIRLDKRIPAGAGLGGGSSDAAAVLRALNALHGGPLAPGELSALGAELGSDVPFFLGESPLALGGGRGEQLRPCPPLPRATLVLALPPVHVDTGGAYRLLDRAREAEEPSPGEDPGELTAPPDWDEVRALATNDFQPVIAAAHPEVARSLEALRGAGARPALLSGSGAACFGLFPHRSVALSSAQALEERLGWPCMAVETLARWPEMASPGG